MSGAFRVGAAYDLQLTSWRLFYVPPTVLVLTILRDAVDHHLFYHLVSWHSPYIESKARHPTVFILPTSTLLFLGFPQDTPLSFTEGVGNGVTSLWHTVRLVLLSSSISPPLLYFTHPYTDLRLSPPYSPSFPIALYHASRLTCPMKLSTQVFVLSQVFLLIPILFMIFPCFPLCNPLDDIFNLHPYTFKFSIHVLFTHPPHSLLTSPLSDAACFP